MLTTSDLLDQINQQHATSFPLLDRYARGEQGAFALSDAAGERFVLKWASSPSVLPRFERAWQVTARLRALGYPAPQYVLVGCTADAAYAIQRALPGQPMQQLPLALVADFLTLNACQADQARSETMTWPEGVIDWDGWCAGDRMFDVATMLFYSYADPAVRSQLWQTIREQSGPASSAVYLAHLIHRQVDWSIRYHTAEAIEHWQAVATAVLGDLGRLFQ